MALLNYMHFKLKKTALPNPEGPLSAHHAEVDLRVEEAKKRGRSPDFDVKTLLKKNVDAL